MASRAYRFCYQNPVFGFTQNVFISILCRITFWSSSLIIFSGNFGLNLGWSLLGIIKNIILRNNDIQIIYVLYTVFIQTVLYVVNVENRLKRRANNHLVRLDLYCRPPFSDWIFLFENPGVRAFFFELWTFFSLIKLNL